MLFLLFKAAIVFQSVHFEFLLLLGTIERRIPKKTMHACKPSIGVTQQSCNNYCLVAVLCKLAYIIKNVESVVVPFLGELFLISIASICFACFYGALALFLCKTNQVSAKSSRISIRHGPHGSQIKHDQCVFVKLDNRRHFS